MNVVSDCVYQECSRGLMPWNSAVDFPAPAGSVRRAVTMGLMKAKQRILEIGSGNLRNGLFVMQEIPRVKYEVIETSATISRFKSKYGEFERQGGICLQDKPRIARYVVAICTFVLETICPTAKRLELAKAIAKAIRKDGIFIGSFRGYPGVRGTKYKQCLAKESMITPRHTFVRPMSIPEVKELLEEVGLACPSMLQQYRVDQPENIHVIARMQ